MTKILPARRDILRSGLALTAAAMGALAGEQDARAAATSFRFVHITDMHIQPELGAQEGVDRAFRLIKSTDDAPDFALVGGDLVMDAALVPRERADQVYGLWREAAHTLNLPLRYSIGNHDLYGLKEADAAKAADPDYGKGLWKKRLGLERTYGTFDHKGWRFVTLDSTGITPAGSWEGVLDAAQITWLDDLLRHTPRAMPMIFLTHFPMFTIFSQYTEATTSALPPGMVVKNGKTFFEMIQNHNVKAVFQGHTHVVEECTYLGTRYITGGAICGDWWKGKRLGVHPEGFVKVSVQGETLSWKYVPYGWKARV